MVKCLDRKGIFIFAVLRNSLNLNPHSPAYSRLQLSFPITLAKLEVKLANYDFSQNLLLILTRQYLTS